MTPDAPRPDLDEAERIMRGELDGTTTLNGWYYATQRVMVEYDRRGAALVDAQAEIARLREIEAAVRAWMVTPGRKMTVEDVGRQHRRLQRAPAPAEDCPTPFLHGPEPCPTCQVPVTFAVPAPAEDGPGYTGECFGDCEVCTAAPAPAEDECPPICGELGSLHGPGHPCVLPPGHELHRDGVGGEWTHPPAHWGPAPRPAAPALAEDEEA